ncbi:MAG: arginine deiminase family protein [Acidobacteriota bacterium]
MVRNEGEKLRRVVASAPGRAYFEVENPAAHNIEELADRRLATAQHRRLREVLEASGARVINLKELAGHPNSVFVRDSGLVTPRGFIRLRMGLPTRRGEEEWMAGILESLGIPCAGAVEEPGTIEGGDVILAGPVAFVGQSERTNKSGVRQISRLLMRMDYEVRSLALPAPYLHIGGAMSAVGPKTILCCQGLFPKGFFAGYDLVEIPPTDATGANVIALGNGEVLAEKSSRAAARALGAAGIAVKLIDLSEFVKGRGGPTCLILPVERFDSQDEWAESRSREDKRGKK